MLFKRKNKKSVLAKVRDFIWPRAGWKRASEYVFHRVARLKGTSYSIAAGVASGAAVSFTPFLGLHFLMGFALAFIVRGNMIAAAIGTAIGNPWTFPFIFALTGKIGGSILGTGFVGKLPDWSWSDAAGDPWQYFVYFLKFLTPYLVGGIPVAIAVWVFFYYAMKLILDTYQKRRMERRAARGKRRVEEVVAKEKLEADINDDK